MSDTGRRMQGVWNRKVARLPAEGVLLIATDLQGNRNDYERLKEIYQAEEAAGNDPVLAICGDLVHGPSPDLNDSGAWPEHLGTPYVDESRELLLDFEGFTQEARAFSLMGNHEHAHVGGPVVAKFYEDEASVLVKSLGSERSRMEAFIREFPLLAVAPCGAVLTHGAPSATEPGLDAFEALDYAGYERIDPLFMTRQDTLGALLWARSATMAQAQALLRATSLDGEPNAFVAYGHDVVHEGYEVIGREQVCVSTSFGLLDENKVYLRLDLSRRYDSARDLHEGHEIRKLYPSV